tara:strand:+ start:33 stop:170 length:138 start_codon:yes stop_codon:yes gene_type:complete
MKHALLYVSILAITYLATTASLTKSTQIDCYTYNVQAACQELARK